MCRKPSCPYGTVLLIPIFFICAAFMYTLYTAFDCDLVRVEIFSKKYQQMQNVSFGLWTIQDYDNTLNRNRGVYYGKNGDKFIGWRQECIRYDWSDEVTTKGMDKQFKFARDCLLAAVILSFILIVWILRPAYTIISNGHIYFMTTVLMLTCMLTGLGLMVRRSSLCAHGRCHMGFTSKICICATVFWFVAALFTCCCLP